MRQVQDPLAGRRNTTIKLCDHPIESPDRRSPWCCPDLIWNEDRVRRKAMLKAALTPQARHHFRMLDQVNALVEARDTDLDLGFMVRLVALCSLPRSNPGQWKEYVRRNGAFTLVMGSSPAGGEILR